MYKVKKGYLIGNNFSQVIQALKDFDIEWHQSNIKKLEDNNTFWLNNAKLLKSDYVIIDLSNPNTFNAFDLGVVWTINYIRKILSRSGHKPALKQLDKFKINEKTLLSINKDNGYLLIATKDQGKVFKNENEIIEYIKNKEK